MRMLFGRESYGGGFFPSLYVDGNGTIDRENIERKRESVTNLVREMQICFKKREFALISLDFYPHMYYQSESKCITQYSKLLKWSQILNYYIS